MRAEGLSLRAIAQRIGRSPNSISYELNRNRVSGEYDPVTADRKAYLRRKDAKYQGMKIVANDALKSYVDIHLYDDQSPEAIAGRLKTNDRHLPYASKDSIRRYIESAYGGRVAYHRMQRRKKRTWHKKRPQVTQLKDRTFIDKRPRYIQKRCFVGDAEADFIVSGKSGKGILLTLADRKIRISFLEKILDVTIVQAHQAFQRIKERFPELTSISTDNDLLLAKHKELERMLGIKIYFCHPYHSWEKGTIENTNKYIRRDIPKGSDISRCSRRFIRDLEAKLNRRYMAVLNYKTPQEMLDRHRKQKKRRSAVRNRKK